jgi:hypothetical protein
LGDVRKMYAKLRGSAWGLASVAHMAHSSEQVCSVRTGQPPWVACTASVGLSGWVPRPPSKGTHQQKRWSRLACQWPPQTRQALAPKVPQPQLPGALPPAPLRGSDGCWHCPLGGSAGEGYRPDPAPIGMAVPAKGR